MTVGSEHFPDYDVTARAHTWDPVTQHVVLDRVTPDRPLQFFTATEERVARPLLARLLALEDMPEVPVLELIDARLAAGETDGWRHEDMPEDGDAWRRSLRFLDDDARSRRSVLFAELTVPQQKDQLEDVRTARRWRGLEGRHLWNLWMRYACVAFYSHPHAWNEMGFGGPAYPVGYANLGLDRREHWEVSEDNAFDPEPWAQRVDLARRRHRGEA